MSPLFTGQLVDIRRCTDRVEFYVSRVIISPFLFMFILTAASQTDYNYHRALVWTAIMTAMSHLDPDFKNVVSIQAVNEPIMDAKKTPGFGDCMLLFII